MVLQSLSFVVQGIIPATKHKLFGFSEGFPAKMSNIYRNKRRKRFTMSKKQSLAENIVKEEEAGLELGTFAKEVLGISNRKLQQAVRTKGLRVNGRSAHSKRKVRSGDKVEVLLPAKEQIKIEIAEPTDLKVLFEDSWLFAAEKPAGIPTYDSKGARGLANQV